MWYWGRCGCDGFTTTYAISTYHHEGDLVLFFCLMVFNTTFNNISVTSWCSVLLVEETGENHRPVASHWQTSLHDVVHLAQIEIRTDRKSTRLRLNSPPYFKSSFFPIALISRSPISSSLSYFCICFLYIVDILLIVNMHEIFVTRR
jgi:hypothetical protein